MRTIKDYIEQYGNTSFDTMPITEADIFLTSILSYIPFPKMSGKISFKSLIREVSKIDKKTVFGTVAPLCISLAKELAKYTRYDDVYLENMQKVVNDKTQFGVATFLFPGQTVIAFEGTAGTTIGWIENIRLMYEYPTYSQNLARDYLNQNLKLLKDNVILCGHSKGGNLAMSAAMECNPELQNKIQKIYNFDGPGFWPEYIQSEKFKSIENRIVNILPNGSYIGAMMSNNGKYTLIKTNGIALAVHYPTTWSIPDTQFVRDGRMMGISEHIYTMSTIGLAEINKNELKMVVEAGVMGMGKPGNSKMKITFRDISRAIDGIKNTSPITKEFVKDLFRATTKLAIKTKFEEVN